MKDLRRIEAELIAQSRELSLAEWRCRPEWVKALQGIARLADTLL